MNQTKNFIQWKNLSKEQKAGFDFENYRYEMQLECEGWVDVDRSTLGVSGRVYRLKIEQDKFYAVGYYGDPHTDSQDDDIKIVYGEQIGRDIPLFEVLLFEVLRPATADEIPKPSIEYIIPTDDDAKKRPECEFSNDEDFNDKYHRTLIAVLSGEGGKDKYICAYSWRTADQFKYCRMVK